MKRLITAVVFIFIGTAIAVFGYFNLRSICSEMNDSLTELIKYAESEDKDATQDAAKYAKGKWDKKNSLLGVYTNHSEMDELQIIMKDLNRLADEENYEDLIEDCYECIYHFEHIRETETPGLGNVF